MICPSCFKTIDDGLTFCPHCSAYVGDASEAHEDFVFCEGCGARLSSHDRTCPKCGRPAPGILSTSSASSDLAAGKTASFPKISPALIETEAPRPQGPTVASMLADAPDPEGTNVLRLDQIEDAADRPAGNGADAYHKPRRKVPGGLIAAVVCGALLLGAGAFVVADPLGVMPGVITSFENAAQEMFPARQLPEDTPPGEVVEQQSAAPSGKKDSAKGKDAKDKGDTPGDVLGDNAAYRQLRDAHGEIVDAHDELENIIDDYNDGFEANDKSYREEKSQSAYDARDSLDKVVDTLKAMKLEPSSPYKKDVSNLIKLAGYVRTRVDIYCQSWDISLSFTGDDRPLDHEAEILAPLREHASEDAKARDAFYDHEQDWKPSKKTS